MPTPLHAYDTPASERLTWKQAVALAHRIERERPRLRAEPTRIATALYVVDTTHQITRDRARYRSVADWERVQGAQP